MKFQSIWKQREMAEMENKNEEDENSNDRNVNEKLILTEINFGRFSWNAFIYEPNIDQGKKMEIS